MNYSLPHFGEINPNQLEEYYDVDVVLGDLEISIDLNFENKSIDQSELDSIQYFLNNITLFDSQNKVFIKDDFEEGGVAAEYIEFYLDECDDTELSSIINIQDSTTPRDVLLLKELKLIRVGLYPSDKSDTEHFATFDYSIYIDGEPCNQLLVVNTNKLGGLDHITWES